VRLRIHTWGLLFAAPAVIFFAVVNVAPMLWTLVLSFHEHNLLSDDRAFVGLANYTALVSDRVFLRAAANTLAYVVLTVPLGLALSLAVAVLLDSGVRAAGLFRTVFFIPVVTSMVAVGYIWSWLYDPTFGILDYVLSFVGVQLPFLKSPATALPSIALMSVWKNLGFNIVIFLAGLQAVPTSMYEAAAIDGTSRTRTFLRVTLPLLNPTVVFLAVMGVMGSLKIFGEVFVMAPQGGPLHSTTSVVFEIVRTSFRSGRMGYGAAMSVILFAMILGVTIVQLRLLGSEDE
jgi:multiple sugar transport system permease protein